MKAIEKSSPNPNKILNSLRKSLSPFESFVSKASIEEFLPLTQNREYIINKLGDALDISSKKQIIPIVGRTGVGKTFVLWQIKKSVKIPAPTIFAEVPANSNLFYYDVYLKIVEEIGHGKLREITRAISDMWGTKEISYGFFPTTNSQKVLDNAKQTPRYRWSKHAKQLEEIFTVIISHSMDPERSPLAEKWLLGTILDNDELFFMGIEHNLSYQYIAEELLDILLHYLPEIILMFDDIDKNWIRFQAEDLYLDDDEWTQPMELEVEETEPDSDAPDFFVTLGTALKKNRELKILITLHRDNMDILEKFPENMASYFNKAVYIHNFSSKEVKQYYSYAFNRYLTKYRLEPVPDNPFFPLTEKFLLLIHQYTHGNPREVIRNISNALDTIIFEDIDIGALETQYRQKIRDTT